jgi:nucleoside-diphosphate-sugar epimerase
LKILVTGSNGFTGAHFIHQAAAAGHETHALTADLTRPDAIAQEIATLEADAVVHFAGIAYVAHADQRAFYDVNLFGTLNLLEALHSAGRPWRKIILASSANVYGNCEQSPVQETQPPAPVNHYAMSKLAMEHLARARYPQLPLLVTRPFNYTGAGQSPSFVIPKLVDHFRRRAPSVALGNLHVEREYNDVRFVCEAYLRLLECPAADRVYNLCTGRTCDFETVIGMLRELTGHSIEVRVDPALIRSDEVHRLCGDPARLQQAIGTLPAPALEETLSWMLAGA